MSDMAGLRIPKLPPTIVGTPSLAPNIYLSNPVVSGLKSMYKVGLCSRFNKNLTNRCAAARRIDWSFFEPRTNAYFTRRP